MVDPYRDWLNVPTESLPPNHYQLLDLPPDADCEQIDTAAANRLAIARRYQVGRFAAEAQRLIDEIAAAYGVLRDPARRRAYDEQLYELKETLPSHIESLSEADDCDLPSPLPVESTWTPSDESGFPNPLRPADKRSHWPGRPAMAMIGLGIAAAIAVAAIVAAAN